MLAEKYLKRNSPKNHFCSSLLVWGLTHSSRKEKNFLYTCTERLNFCSSQNSQLERNAIRSWPCYRNGITTSTPNLFPLLSLSGITSLGNTPSAMFQVSLSAASWPGIRSSLIPIGQARWIYGKLEPVTENAIVTFGMAITRKNLTVLETTLPAT